jgi:uncharacterized membrane protein
MIYEGWVEHRLEAPDSEIATVQILRNVIMANSTLISALFILLGILLGFYGTNISGDLLVFGVQVDFFKITLNVTVIIFCILNFVMSVRSINRCSLLMTGDPEKYNLGDMNGIEATKEAFIASKNHWMFGIRALFFLVASMTWFISSLLLIAASIGITIYLILVRDIKRIKIKKKPLNKS